MSNGDRVVLIQSAGLNPDGTMTVATEKNCHRALHGYHDGRIDTIFLAAADSDRYGRQRLVDQMALFLTRRRVRDRDIVKLPVTMKAQMALDKCREWAECIGN